MGSDLCLSPVTDAGGKTDARRNLPEFSGFDSVRFTGANLASDERMLPPNLQGYAPEVHGIARSNAKVTVSQQGRVIYQTTVPAGPFNIQDLHGSVRGTLDVRVEEQDGSVQTFQVNTADIPYLTRPGYVRYNAAVGKPSRYNHDVRGLRFIAVIFLGSAMRGRCMAARCSLAIVITHGRWGLGGI